MQLDTEVRANYYALLVVGVMWTAIGAIWLYLGLTGTQRDTIFGVGGRVWLGGAALVGAMSVLFIAYWFRAHHLD